MIPIRIDREAVSVDTTGMRDLGSLLGALEAHWNGRVVVSALLNGWERIDFGNADIRQLPLDLVSDVWIETESVGDAASRIVRNACALAIHAANTASQAGAAFVAGHDGDGYAHFASLCTFVDDLSSAADALRDHPECASGFLDAWRARCVPAIATLVDAGEARDPTLFADHLLYDVAPAFEALGASGSM
jgi:hypothetical protein